MRAFVLFFVGEQEQYDKAHRILPLCPTLERIIIFDPSVRISSHDPHAIFFEDFLKLGEGFPRQSEVENDGQRQTIMISVTFYILVVQQAKVKALYLHTVCIMQQ